MIRNFRPEQKRLSDFIMAYGEQLDPSCDACAHVDEGESGDRVCWRFRGAVTGRPISTETLRAPGGACGVTGREWIPGGPDVYAGGVDVGLFVLESERACVNCVFHELDTGYRQHWDGHRCRRFMFGGGAGHCGVERGSHGRCGLEGRGFEPAEPVDQQAGVI